MSTKVFNISLQVSSDLTPEQLYELYRSGDLHDLIEEVVIEALSSGTPAVKTMSRDDLLAVLAEYDESEAAKDEREQLADKSFGEFLAQTAKDLGDTELAKAIGARLEDLRKVAKAASAEARAKFQEIADYAKGGAEPKWVEEPRPEDDALLDDFERIVADLPEDEQATVRRAVDLISMQAAVAGMSPPLKDGETEDDEPDLDDEHEFEA